jgi:hypothetical protein
VAALAEFTQQTIERKLGEKKPDVSEVSNYN